ncbi:MAG: 2-amino-4-hydroxy-6-hydroxymethyldihydropteridine diphosphokinase [Candidatus Marinimicrobia bacterium]|jgi:2-amino-4-hydroxy-6-hydroxymethyldihydropteridine diphosphokinase|nr:2-amino-4-hydroxy-6-hydroxymethyldihydropteridine diphosphokinase [Candidatus Neomarinimicrobiota bacterium]MDP6789703.1 2-amino-4-hydroxy-6-hydroxymethyldihydropteridine diphosphokinase [Candidatus Neomarinimicrobiota bacterium]MDP7071610.1 2-amino-4-hydroxy-6-hydroxymethyldihydropteridine diphosphokinase [Candidatus Neomarinimicrobiota bacterium]
MGETVYLGIGSNLFDRDTNISKAIDLIKNMEAFSFTRMASIYETPPLYNTIQPDFLNTVIEGNYDAEPHELLAEIQSAEAMMGRPADRQKNQPRVIDVDILIFGERIIENTSLEIPHPKLAERRFVLEPLAEISPDFPVPKFDRTPVELLAECSDKSSIQRISVSQVA